MMLDLLDLELTNLQESEYNLRQSRYVLINQLPTLCTMDSWPAILSPNLAQDWSVT